MLETLRANTHLAQNRGRKGEHVPNLREQIHQEFFLAQWRREALRDFSKDWLDHQPQGFSNSMDNNKQDGPELWESQKCHSSLIEVTKRRARICYKLFSTAFSLPYWLISRQQVKKIVSVLQKEARSANLSPGSCCWCGVWGLLLTREKTSLTPWSVQSQSQGIVWYLERK